MADDPFKTIQLDNGLTLTLHDRSRRIAADRWHLLLVARVEIPLADAALGEAAEAVRSALGDRVVYEQRRERNFISEELKAPVFDELCRSFLASGRPYLSHPEFAGRFALQKYREDRKRARPLRG